MKTRYLVRRAAETDSLSEAPGEASCVKFLSVPKHRTGTIPGKQKIERFNISHSHSCAKAFARDRLIGTFSPTTALP